MLSVVYQVRWAMYEECCAADVSEGREFQSGKLGTGMEDGETKERGRGEGAKYAACDTETYETRCALEVGEEETRAVKAAKREAGQERVDARESERWTVEEEVSAWWVQQHNQRRRRTHRIFGAVKQCVLRGAPATLPGGGDHLQAHRDACAIVVVDKKTSFDQQDAQRVIRLSQRWASCLPPAEGHAATRERLRHRAVEFVRSLKAHAHALSGSESAREMAAAGGYALPGGELGEFVTPAAAAVEELGRAAWSQGLTVKEVF